MQNCNAENTYIDFFSGCGGLSLGLGWAGWKGIFAIEKDPMAFSTFEKNLISEDAPYCHFKDWPTWLSKAPHTIEDVLGDEELVKQLKELSGKVTLVAGGPPCQGFSVAGSRNGNDPRNLLVFKQIEAVKILKPIYVIIENVGGFEHKFVSKPIDGIDERSVADEAIRQLDILGYNVGKLKINAADYGVPQIRERVILFAVSKQFAGTLSAEKLLGDVLKTVGTEQRQEFGLATERFVNIEEAISDLAGEEIVPDPEFPDYKTCKYKTPQSDYQRLMRKGMRSTVPSCHRFNKHSKKLIALYDKAHRTQPVGRLSKEFLYENGCHSNKRFVLDVNKPSSTLTTAPDELIHYKHNRIVTLREMARLQSFPDNFAFCGRYTLNGPARGIDVPRNAQIGNAIPPLVGRALGAALIKITAMILGNSVELEQYRPKKLA